MKKKFLVFVLVLFGLFCIGCSVTQVNGPSGNAFLKYTWIGKPLALYDENPSTPATVYNGTYFSTNPGTYYMDYKAFDGSEWWMNYTITVNKGSGGSKGADLWFEITLYSTGPTLYKWTYEKNVHESEKAGRNETIKYVSNSESSTGMERGPIVGTEERVTEYGSIRIEYGRMIE